MSASSNTTATVPTPTSQFSSIFQSAGGPPLILVCIAGGLLIGAFVGMFIMKRLRPSVVVNRVNVSGRAQPQLGEKPTLFDVLIAAPEQGSGKHLRDRNAPFAAVYLPSDDDKAAAPSPSSTLSPSALSRVMASLRRHTGFHKGHIPAPPQTPQPRKVQLAFAVAMPDPAFPASKGTTHDVHEDQYHEHPMPDCCIGTTILPYRPGPV
ncbi:hypothetical protein BN946_scf184844.g107 [Trametes cinnabarina]|uniref:Uncharacterized protein n=1 Tax=Pycnoporus cinnabarinus TaxID=5643 RepID=A0A060SFC0_PYCCI|nr:hypothetical protein BN946_scf184844.g107 [Trametes cinnabarina]